MGLPILEGWHLYIKSGPRFQRVAVLYTFTDEIPLAAGVMKHVPLPHLSLGFPSELLEWALGAYFTLSRAPRHTPRGYCGRWSGEMTDGNRIITYSTDWICLIRYSLSSWVLCFFVFCSRSINMDNLHKIEEKLAKVPGPPKLSPLDWHTGMNFQHWLPNSSRVISLTHNSSFGMSYYILRNCSAMVLW